MYSIVLLTSLIIIFPVSVAKFPSKLGANFK